MTINDDESDLKKLFAAEPAVEPPPFDRLWSQAAREQRHLRASTRRRNVALALAAVLALAFTGYLQFRPRPQTEVDYISLERMDGWRSSTDFLLQTPGTSLLESTPDLQSTVSMKDFTFDNKKTEEWKR